ncbi:MAG: glycosyl transferase [Lachnospiraceae bacterium]|nr:glycosyl transferase [Lachnospiraceae bacterium]
MIPKIIHYCWFGKEGYPDLTKKCIESWKNILPEYDFILWNEDTFDIESVQFTREAYAVKKYAFVSDYVRVYALKKYGGIYFDTDVEVLKKFDDLLQCCGFVGIEETLLPACGIIGCEPENPIISEFFDFYQDKKFYNDIGQYDMTPNPCHFERILLKHGYRKKNIKQDCGGFEVFPSSFFYPPYIDNEWKVTQETFTIHHYMGSWALDKDEQQIEYENGMQKYVKIFGHRVGEKIYRNVIRIKQRGFLVWLGFCINRICKSK